MIFKSRLFGQIVTCAALALLSCTGQENPFKTQDANVNLVVENSLNQLSKDSVTDTVENLVRVGLSAYLPTYITQVTVIIARGTADTDKVITFANASTWTDTQWININLHTIGKHTVTVVTTLQGSAQKTSIANIDIIGKKIPLAANPLSNSVTEGQSDTFFVSVNGTGSVFTYQWIQNGIILSGANKDTFIVTPVYVADSGSYSCIIKDQWGDSVVSQPAFLHVQANPAVNHKPVLIVSGARSIVSGQACALSLSETDADSGQTHTYAMLKSPAGATLTGTSFAWSSPATFEGIDTVIFTVADNGNPPMSDTQNVYITVGSQSVKTPPVIMIPAADTAPSVAQGKVLRFTVQTVASAGDTVTVSAASISGANLPDSAVFNPTNGQFTWTPTFGELGVYSIVITATDGNGVSKDTVKITVTKTDRAPTVQAQSVNTTTGQAITISLLASDPDNDSIVQWQVTQKPRNGTATLADSTKGSIEYMPNASFAGVDTFAVKASDGTLWSAAANIIVTVSSLKVAPKITAQPRTDTSVALGGSV
jgi:Bacterial Ig domain